MDGHLGIKSERLQMPLPCLKSPKNQVSDLIVVSELDDDRKRLARSNTDQLIKIKPAPDKKRTVYDQLMKLYTWTKPGLTEEEFRELFVKCECGLIMTVKVFDDHECRVIKVIDLTKDDD
jgi:hypothetical protein